MQFGVKNSPPGSLPAGVRPGAVVVSFFSLFNFGANRPPTSDAGTNFPLWVLFDYRDLFAVGFLAFECYYCLYLSDIPVPDPVASDAAVMTA